MDTIDAAAAMEALGNPTRLAIYRRLVRAGALGLPVGAIQQAMGLAGSTLSHHLKSLLIVGLITRRREGTQLICVANYSLMEALVGFLAAECCTGGPVALTPGAA